MVHEWGHFYYGQKVWNPGGEVLPVFDFLFPMANVMNFSLLKRKGGDTEYGIGWTPLGGYVKIAGMVDESMDKEAMNQPAQDWEFHANGRQRLIVMLGGIIVNVIVG